MRVDAHLFVNAVIRKLGAMNSAREKDFSRGVLRYILRETSGEVETLTCTDGFILLSFQVPSGVLDSVLSKLSLKGWRVAGKFIVPPKEVLPDESEIYPDWRRALPSNVYLGQLHDAKYKAARPRNLEIAAKFCDRSSFIPNFYCTGENAGFGFADSVEGFVYIMPLKIHGTDSHVELLDPVSECPWIKADGNVK